MEGITFASKLGSSNRRRCTMHALVLHLTTASTLHAVRQGNASGTAASLSATPTGVDRQCASPGQTNLHRHGDNGDDRHGLIGIKPIKGPRLRLCSRLKSSSCPGTPATTRVSLFESLSALFSVSTCVCCQRRRPSQHHGLPQERLPGAARRRGRQSMACFCGWHVCCVRRCSLWVRSIIRCHLSVSSSPTELTVRLG